MDNSLTAISALEAGFDTLIISKKDGAVKDVRTQSFETFKSLGFPGKKTEAYKYSPVDKFIEKNIDYLQVNDAFGLSKEEVQQHFYDLPGTHLVFANGTFSSELSLIKSEDVTINTIDEDNPSEMLETLTGEHDAFAALNAAFFSTGLQILANNKKIRPQVFIYYVFDLRNGQICSFPRLNIEVAELCEIDLVEKLVFVGEGTLFHNVTTEIKIGKNATLNLTKNQVYADNHIVVDGIYAHQRRDSKIYFNTFSFSGAMVRNNLNIAQNDEHCESYMNGLYLLDGNSHVDNNTAIDHKQPHSYSNELYKGVVDDKSRGVFNGKIYVRPGAQQTNAFQANNNISLSDAAIVNTKPQLEIWADDVKCSHGCTIGQLDEEAIFYLRARGLSEISAKAMMLVAFAEDTLNHVPVEQVKEEVATIIENRLGQ
ncbi:MAG: Fe-S cluster assembly protein SufD [Cytophagales bacterium]|nr:Fe-S cluster assembly protein SufD [Cytophagales bacterium]